MTDKPQRRTVSPTRPTKEGQAIEVRSRFDGRWVGGFQADHMTAGGMWKIRRRSDGVVLPSPFPSSDLRPESRR